jgi:hypothetical protein
VPLCDRQAAQESALRRDRGESKFADKRRAGRREGDRVAPTVGGVLVATDHSTLDKGFDIGADVAAIASQVLDCEASSHWQQGSPFTKQA